jgi:hypothetical protein
MLRTQPVKLPPELGTERGILVFDEEVLVAVFACLDGDFYGNDCGKWHVEASFSPAIEIGAVLHDIESELADLDERLTQPSGAAPAPSTIRWRLGLVEGEPQYDELEQRLAKAPVIGMPTITLEGDANGAPHPTPAPTPRCSPASTSTGSYPAA